MILTLLDTEVVEKIEEKVEKVQAKLEKELAITDGE